MARIKGQKPLTAAEQQEIARRYETGETLEALMAEYRRGKPMIRKVVRDAGVAIRPRGYGKDREWTPEWRAAHKAGCSTPEFAQKSREALLKRLPTMRGPAINTAIEQRMHDALMAAGIGFTTQSVLLSRYLVDIELHQAPIVIEADGAQHTLRDPESQGRRTRRRTDRSRIPGLPVYRQRDQRRRRRMRPARHRRLRAGAGAGTGLHDPHEVLGRTPSALEGRQARVRLRVVRQARSLPSRSTGRASTCIAAGSAAARVKTGTKLGPMPAEQRAKIGAAHRRNHQIKVESELA